MTDLLEQAKKVAEWVDATNDSDTHVAIWAWENIEKNVPPIIRDYIEKCRQLDECERQIAELKQQLRDECELFMANQSCHQMLLQQNTIMFETLERIRQTSTDLYVYDIADEALGSNYVDDIGNDLWDNGECKISIGDDKK